MIKEDKIHKLIQKNARDPKRMSSTSNNHYLY